MDFVVSLLLILCSFLFLLTSVFVVYVVVVYNNLRIAMILVDEAWSGIGVQLKKRFDLIPNLVETVKGYMSHESSLLEKITSLRSNMVSSVSDVDKIGKLEGEFRSTLKTLFAVAENYPDLKANQNFLSLQSTLKSIEDDIEKSRRYYNGTVRDLNSKIVVFPNNFIANLFSIKQRNFFEIVESEKENVKINLEKNVSA